MSSLIAIQYTCNHCGRVFYGPQMCAEITSKEQANQLAQFGVSLQNHVAEHQEIAQQIGISVSELTTMLVLQHFRSTEWQLAKKIDMSRWNVHQRTRGISITDDHIAQSVEQVIPELITLAQMGDKEELRRNLIEFMKGLRNSVEERGKYQLPQLAAV